MTKVEWNACTDPTPMLEVLRGKASARKLRLLAYACVRRISHLLADDRGRQAIEVAERFADGLADPAERRIARDASWAAVNWVDDLWVSWPAAFAGTAATLAASDGNEIVWDYSGRCINPTGRPADNPDSHAAGAALCSAEAAAFEAAQRREAGWQARPAWERAWREAKRVVRGDSPLVHFALCRLTLAVERKEQASLIREVFGHPFRPANVDPAYLGWSDGAIRKMAQAIYDERAFDRLPVLADALEDAGCTDATILSHCRVWGEHVRGCWVVDALLDKT